MRTQGLKVNHSMPLKKGKPHIPSIFEWIGIRNPISLGLMFLLACLLTTGLSLVLTTHKNRIAFTDLQELKARANQLETERGQLLIEQSTFGVEGRIEQKATDQLQMQLPELSKIVMLKHD